VGGKEHFMYAVTAETLRSREARHTHFRIFRGNLKNVYACVYNFVVVAAVIVKTRIMCVCMYVYYTVVLVPGEPLRS
jgi:hypothetical protein